MQFIGGNCENSLNLEFKDGSKPFTFLLSFTGQVNVFRKSDNFSFQIKSNEVQEYEIELQGTIRLYQDSNVHAIESNVKVLDGKDNVENRLNNTACLSETNVSSQSNAETFLSSTSLIDHDSCVNWNTENYANDGTFLPFLNDVIDNGIQSIILPLSEQEKGTSTYQFCELSEDTFSDCNYHTKDEQESKEIFFTTNAQNNINAGITKPSIDEHPKRFETIDRCMIKDQTETEKLNYYILEDHSYHMIYYENCSRVNRSKAIQTSNELSKGTLEPFIQVQNSLTEDSFICGICYTTFETRKGLDSHLENHWIVAQYACAECQFVISTRARLDEHINNIHAKKYKCGECSNSFSDSGGLKLHIQLMHEEKDIHKSIKSKTFVNFLSKNCKDNVVYQPISKVCIENQANNILHTSFGLAKASDKKVKDKFQSNYSKEIEKLLYNNWLKRRYSCSLCSFTSKSSASLRDHKLNKHTIKRYPCFKCSKKFTKYYLNRHIQNVHGEHSSNEPHKCMHCTYVTYDRGEMSNHISFHKDKRYVCEFCGKTQINSTHLKYHIMRKHSSNEKKIKCSECDYRAKVKGDVKIHYKNNHTISNSPDGPPFICSICNRRLANKYNLQAHMETHSTLTPYVCPDCSYVTHTRYRLRQHIAVNHAPKKIKCDLCPRMFANLRTLHGHAKCHESKVQTQKKFRCSYCKFSTFDKNEFTNHRTSDCYYFCDICGAKYSTKKSFKEHKIRAHAPMEEERFACNHCDFKSPLKQDVLAHQKTVHNKQKKCCDICTFETKYSYNLKKHYRFVHKVLV